MKSIRFTLNGKVVESFAGHVDTSGEFKQDPAYQVLNPLQILNVNEGAVLSKPIRISGEACTFEANVFWRLSQGGKKLKEGSTTAASGCPERSPWSLDIVELKAGDYKIEVIEYSSEDGKLFATDDKNFTVK